MRKEYFLDGEHGVITGSPDWMETSSISRERTIFALTVPFQGQTFLSFQQAQKKFENSGLAPFLLQASEDPDGSPKGMSGSLCLSLQTQRVEGMVLTMSLFLDPQSPALDFLLSSQLPGLPTPYYSTQCTKRCCRIFVGVLGCPLQNCVLGSRLWS